MTRAQRDRTASLGLGPRQQDLWALVTGLLGWGRRVAAGFIWDSRGVSRPGDVPGRLSRRSPRGATAAASVKKPGLSMAEVLDRVGETLASTRSLLLVHVLYPNLLQLALTSQRMWRCEQRLFHHLCVLWWRGGRLRYWRLNASSVAHSSNAWCLAMGAWHAASKALT
jgi:hypothetical protein